MGRISQFDVWFSEFLKMFYSYTIFKSFFFVIVDLPSIEIFAIFLFIIPVAPDAIHNHVKTYREEQRNMHYIAPEYGGRLPG